MVDKALSALGRRRRIVVTVPSFPAAIQIAAASDLIATLPRVVAERADDRETTMLPPPLDVPRSVAYLWWHPRFQQDPGHSWWRHVLFEAFHPFRRDES